LEYWLSFRSATFYWAILESGYGKKVKLSEGNSAAKITEGCIA